LEHRLTTTVRTEGQRIPFAKRKVLGWKQGGSSGSNGTICIRGIKQDHDDWGFPEWSGDEMFRAMKKVYRPADQVGSFDVLTSRSCRLRTSELKISSLTTQTHMV
jgi:hypothetical protein